MSATTNKSPRITRKEIEAYLALGAERKELSRRSSELKKQQDELEDKLIEFTRAVGGKERTVCRSGFILAIKTANGSVSWKTEFVRVAGLDAAEALIAAAEPKESFSVEEA